eukprot:scaffold52988_cov68-Phaeocystis_antarctica.AAC.4
MPALPRLTPTNTRCRSARRDKSCSGCKKFNRVLKQAATQGLLERLQGQSLKIGKVRRATSSLSLSSVVIAVGGQRGRWGRVQRVSDPAAAGGL